MSARTGLAVALSLAATSCVFLVDSLPDGTTSSCNLSTDASVCAICIETSCKTQLDACCGDDSCRGLLIDADECAKDEYCGSLASAGASGKGADFVGCIQASCGASCRGIGEAGSTGDASSCTGCDTTCTTGSTGACACAPATSAKPGNSVVCPTYQLDNPICCETPGWPTSGQCECVSIYCSESNGYCQCSIGAYVEGATNLSSCSANQLDDICCFDTASGNCTCGSGFDCSNSEVQVSECSASTMTCPTSSALSKKTTQCSTFTD